MTDIYNGIQKFQIVFYQGLLYQPIHPSSPFATDKELKTSINCRNASVRTCEQPFLVWPLIHVAYQPACDIVQQMVLREECIE